jgi:hypothetical protein
VTTVGSVTSTFARTGSTTRNERRTRPRTEESRIGGHAQAIVRFLRQGFKVLRIDMDETFLTSKIDDR